MKKSVIITSSQITVRKLPWNYVITLASYVIVTKFCNKAMQMRSKSYVVNMFES